MKKVAITRFAGINNMSDPSALKQPSAQPNGEMQGECELVDCINFDIDDDGGLVKRADAPDIFTKAYDEKLTMIHGGRNFTAVGNILSYTRPFSTEYEDRRRSIAYPANIVMILSVESGVWLSTTESIYFHKGKNPARLGGFTLDERAGYPAIIGTGEVVERKYVDPGKDGHVAIFTTTEGICIGGEDGTLTNVSEDIFSYAPGARGISDIRIEKGLAQYHVRMINDTGDSYNEFERRTSLTVDSY